MQRRYVMCTVLVALAGLHSGGGQAQVSKNDWITAGGYGSLYTLDTEDMPEADRMNGKLFCELWNKTTGQTVETGPENAHKLISVLLGLEHVTADVMDPDIATTLGAGYYVNTYTPSQRHVPFGATPRLVIAGVDAQRTRTGIYGFYRRAFESEWFAPGVAEIRRANFRLEKRNETVQPAFAFREIAFASTKTPEEAEFRIAQGLRPEPLPPHLGRDSSYTLLPPEKKFDAHPEWYAEREGKRIALKEAWRKPQDAAARSAELGELCPLAPGIADAIVVAIEEIMAAPAGKEDDLLRLRRSRAGWLAAEKVWAVTPMASSQACACAACETLRETEGSAMAPWLTLVNAVAEQLEAKHPGEGHRVLTHATGARQSAPKDLKAAPNVIVVVFTNECDFSQPLAARGTNANVAFVDELKRWERVGPQLWVADCLTALNSTPTPFPSERVLQENLQLYTQHAVQGVFFQCTGPFEHDDDFSALKFFLAARLMWEPDTDARDLRERFLTNYYGDAAETLGEWLEARAGALGLGPRGVAQPGLVAAREAVVPKLKLLVSAGDTDPKLARLKALLPKP